MRGIFMVSQIIFMYFNLGSLLLVKAEEQQNYYSIRVSRPFIAPRKDVPPCSGSMDFPPPFCPPGDDVTLSMFNWTSIETTAVAVQQNGDNAVGYNCVTYSVCGYRVYDSKADVTSDPQQFLVVRASVPLVQQVNLNNESRCLNFPSAEPLCPEGREQRSIHNVTSQEVVGLLSHNNRLFGQYECATYAICGYRIFSNTNARSEVGVAHTKRNQVARRRAQSSVPQQFIKVQNSLPQASGIAVFPPPVNCKSMHFFLSQTNNHIVRLRATALASDGSNSSRVNTIGLFDYVTESLCGYANPPHHGTL